MPKSRVLIAYATRYGSTREIAEEIGEILRNGGIFVDVVQAQEIADITGYNGIVIGSPIYMGKWLPEAVEFVQNFQEQFRHVPVALFAVGLGQDKKYAMLTIHAIRPYVHPVSIGIFLGRLQLDILSDADLQMVRLTGAEEGDFRNWVDITAWASELPTYFKEDHSE